ncbi:MAG: hypothetical protein H7336_01030 [Bacteriovorax sp.]|nr:hypothetical protein [Bacteriovorax sp.]
MKLLLKQNTQAFLYCLLTALLFCSFYSLLSSDSVTTYDDTLLLSGIENLHSIHEYADRFFAGKILDIQPVRDLSYIIDFHIKSITPLHSFHLTNLLLWLGICCFFKSILDLIDDNKDKHQWLIWSLVFLYALSPVFTSTVAWIAGRKHLLSTFFTVWATFIFLKKKNAPFSSRTSVGIAALYLLAVLSQPINILWPVFVLVFSYSDEKIKERRFLLCILAAIALAVLCANLYYYGTLYEKITAGDGKYDSNFGPGLSLLALGRYFYLTMFSFDALPVSHYQGSWENMAGMVMMFAFLFWLFKRRTGAAIIFCFVFYFFLPLIPVTYKITRIFCSDTYILNASIGLYAAFFLIFKNTRFKHTALMVFSYAFVLFFINISYIKNFETTDNIFSYAYSKEPTPMSITNVADRLIRQRKFTEARILIDQLEVMEADNRFFSKLKSDLIYHDPQVSKVDKIKGLELIKPKTPIVYLRLALLNSNEGDADAFRINVIKLLSDPQAYIRNSYLRNEEVVALIRVSCEKNRIEGECKKIYDMFGRSVHFNNWKPELYKSIYFELKIHPENLSYD